MTDVIDAAVHPVTAARTAAALDPRHWLTLEALATHDTPTTAVALTEHPGAPLDARHLAGLLRSLAGRHLVTMTQPSRRWRGPALWQITPRGRRLLAALHRR